jgi:hypothetical protein
VRWGAKWGHGLKWVVSFEEGTYTDVRERKERNKLCFAAVVGFVEKWFAAEMMSLMS